MKTSKQSSPSNAPIAFMFLMPVVIMAAFIFHHHYSPLDSYVKATVASDSLNKVAHADAVSFIDSLNSK